MDNFDSNEKNSPVSKSDSSAENPEVSHNASEETSDNAPDNIVPDNIAPDNTASDNAVSDNEAVDDAHKPTNPQSSVWEAYIETVDESKSDEEAQAVPDAEVEANTVKTYDEQLINNTKRFVSGKINLFLSLSKRKQKQYLIIFLTVVILLVMILTDIIPILPNSYHRSYVGNRYTLGETQGSDAAKYGENVLYASNGTLMCFGPDMNVKSKIDTFAGHPIIRTADTGAIVYSKNGDKAVVMNDYDKYFAVNSNEAIISASVNKNGDYILVTVEAGYKACLSAYNSKQGALYKWHTGSNITDTAISPAGTEFVAAVIEQSETEVHSKLVFLTVSSREPIKEVKIEGSIVTGLHFINANTVVAFGDSSTQAFSPNGAHKWSVDYDDKILKTYDINEDGQIAFLFNSYNSDLSDSLIEIYNYKGRKTGYYESKDNVRSISVNNGYCLLVLDKETILVDNDGDIRKRKKHSSDYSRVILYDNYNFAFGINDNIAEIMSVNHR